MPRQNRKHTPTHAASIKKIKYKPPTATTQRAQILDLAKKVNKNSQKLKQRSASIYAK